MSDISTPEQIPGYDYGSTQLTESSVTEEELAAIEETMGWSSTDAECLARHGETFRAKAEAMVDAWRSVIAAQPHLAQWFVGTNGNPDAAYKARIRRRFVQWVIDVAVRPHDRTWLNYQQEIGRRHTPVGKNKTDGASTPSLVPLRYLLGFVPVVLPIRSFFLDAVADEPELNGLQEAWTKAVMLHVTLWARAYTQEGLW